MHGESENHQLPVAELVSDNPAEDDDQAEAPKAAAADVAQFLLGEAVIPGPVHQDAATHAEAYPGRENGEEAGPKEPLGIHCHLVVHGSFSLRIVTTLKRREDRAPYQSREPKRHG